MFDNRLKLLREARGFTQNEIASKVGISQRAYANYERDEREPSAEILLRIAHFFDVSTDYLLGCSVRSDVSAAENVMVKKYRTLDEHGRKMVEFTLHEEYLRCMESEEEYPTIEIRLAHLAASAGTGDYLDSEGYEHITVRKTAETERADFAVRVNGNSMEPTFHNGDILLVEGAPYINHGDIGVFVVNGSGYVKEYGGNKLISHNAEYEDILLHDYDVVLCSGRVIGVLES